MCARPGFGANNRFLSEGTSIQGGSITILMIYMYVHLYTRMCTYIYIYDFTSDSYLIFGLVMPFSAIDPS